MTLGPTSGTKTKAASKARPGTGGASDGGDAGDGGGKGAAGAPMEYTVIVAVRGSSQAKEFLMVRHRDRGWELPGGKFQPNEGPVHCALREFREETGHLLAAPRFITKIRKPNGICFVFTGAWGVAVEGQGPDDSITETKWFSKLPRGEGLAFPDDPYDDMGRLLGIDFG